MNIDSIQNGIVIDHIEAGRAMKIYKMLGFDKLECPVAMIMNVHSNKMGKKDIMKIDGEINLDLEVIGFLSPDSTINVIKNGVRVDKYHVEPPKSLVNVVKCRNARCITTTERDIPHIFNLTNAEKREYRCKYCETLFKE